MKIFGLLFCCTLAFARDCGDNVYPVVRTPTGSYRGSILKSQLGKDIYSFRGIRYADAPIGKNRFKQAFPVKQHDGVYDATDDGPICPQPQNGKRIMSEDCLNLNVYTTKLSLNSNQSNRSVIVFLHAGGFVAFSGSSYDLGPQIMVDTDIVLVVPNYRLGALGFLSTGDSRAPGNAGLKDQVLALRWVKQNIRNFGGNPDSVTLMGYGAGGWSVSLHIVSPLSKGLFHRALPISGAATTQNPLPFNQLDIAKKQAELLECPTDTLDNMFDCLYVKSPEEYAESLLGFTDLNRYSIPIYSPVVENEYCGNNNNEKPFLTGQPADLICQKKANFVPFLSGVNKDEFGAAVIFVEESARAGRHSLYDELNVKWDEIAPIRFGYNRNPRSFYISRELRSFYLNDEPLRAGSYPRLAALLADSMTFFPVHRLERLMANYSTEPVHFYFNIYQGCDTVAKWSNGTHYGVSHYDDLLLLFKIGGHSEHCERDVETAGLIMKFVKNFAETGEPTPENKIHHFPIKWKASTKYHPQYLEFSEGMRMIRGSVYEKRMNEWDKLFP